VHITAPAFNGKLFKLQEILNSANWHDQEMFNWIILFPNLSNSCISNLLLILILFTNLKITVDTVEWDYFGPDINKMIPLTE
jgi:hypothetical protein